MAEKYRSLFLMSGSTKQALVTSVTPYIPYYPVIVKWKNNQKRRDATCPITAEAIHTGGGKEFFKLGNEKIITLVPQFPLAEPAYTLDLSSTVQ